MKILQSLRKTFSPIDNIKGELKKNVDENAAGNKKRVAVKITRPQRKKMHLLQKIW